MTKWRIDRTSIFLCVVGLLFLWDLAYFVGIRDPARFPHPLRVFLLLGDSEFVRGFLRMLRLIILCLVSGGLIGVALGSLILRSSWLTQEMLRFLRLGLWLPFLLLFATPVEAFVLSIAAALLCSCYHYLAARYLLGLRGHDVLRLVGRETILQVLFISLIAQIWFEYWKWFEFAPMFQPQTGVQVLVMLLFLIFFINWIFRSNFDLTARRRETVLTKELNSANWSSLGGAVLFTVICLLIWQALSQSSPLDALKAGYGLLERGELLGDIKVSLLEIVVGMAFGASIALLVFGGIANLSLLRSLLLPLLPLTYISPVVLWLLMFLWYGRHTGPFLDFWHKVVAVGLLSFFPFVQALWGLRDRPLLYSTLLAIDDALPIAFVMMLYGELYAATAGLGFMMTVASATYQTDKGLAGFVTTTVLLVALSAILRWIAKSLHFPERSADVLPAQAS